MKQLHFTGESYWYKDVLYTKINADLGYKLFFKKSKFSIKTVTFTSNNYDEQRKTMLNDFVAIRDWRQAGNLEVQLMDEKKLNDWTKKHKYGKIES